MPVDMTVPNSILRNYLANRQLIQEAQAQQQRHEEAMNTFAQHERQLNEEANQFQELLKFKKMAAGMELRNALAEHLSNIRQISQPVPGLVGTNVTPSGEVSTSGPQDLTSQLGEFGQYIPEFLRTYTPGEDLGAAKRLAEQTSIVGAAQAKNKGLEAGEVAKAEAPYVASKQQFEKELEKMKLDEEETKSMRDANNRMEMTRLELGSREKLGALERQTQLAMNAADVNARIYGINQEYGFDPNSDMGKTMIYNAATDPSFAKKIASSTSPRDMKVATAVSASGLKPVDGLSIEQLRGLDNLEGSLGVMDKIIGHLSTSRAGAMLQHYAVGQKVIPTDLGNELDQLKSVVSNVARGLEGGNARLLATQMNNAANSLGDIRDSPKTRKQVEDLKQNLLDIASRARSELLAPYSPAQRKMIIDRNGLLPDIPTEYANTQVDAGGKPMAIKDLPRMNLKGHRLNPEKSATTGHAVYEGE